jgi:general secretion pathway protein C
MTKKIYTALNIIIITAIAYTAVGCLYLFLQTKFELPVFNLRVVETKQKETRLPRQKLNDYRIIHTRNIFGNGGQQGEAGEKTADIESLEPTSLKISLMGTVFGDRKNEAAIIQDDIKKYQDVYRVGDSIQSAVIKNILREKVILSYKGRDEILIMDDLEFENNNKVTESTANRNIRETQPPNTITLRRADIFESIENLSDVLNQAEIKPHLTDGKTGGLAISSIKPGSFFRLMGFRNGDVIRRVEGNEIRGPEDIISLYNDLKSEDFISLDIIRRGEEKILNYRFR